MLTRYSDIIHAYFGYREPLSVASLAWHSQLTIKSSRADLELRYLRHTTRPHPSTGLYNRKSLLACANEAIPPIGVVGPRRNNSLLTHQQILDCIVEVPLIYQYQRGALAVNQSP